MNFNACTSSQKSIIYEYGGAVIAGALGYIETIKATDSRELHYKDRNWLDRAIEEILEKPIDDQEKLFKAFFEGDEFRDRIQIRREREALTRITDFFGETTNVKKVVLIFGQDHIFEMAHEFDIQVEKNNTLSTQAMCSRALL